MDDKFFEELKERVKNIMREKGDHDINHILRVYNFGIAISEGLDVDLDVIKASALLHDIAREKEINGEIKDHAEQGAIESREILEEMNFPKDKIEIVCRCISLHNKPEYDLKIDELRVLKEADGLEGIGAIGIDRAFLFYGNDIVFYDSLGKSKNILSNLESLFNHDYFKIPKAKELAEKRIEFMKIFQSQFIKEWNQNDV